MSRTILARSHRPCAAATRFLVLLGALALGSAVGAETPPFTLDLLAAGREVPLTVTSNSEVTLNLVRTAVKGAPDNIDLQISQFTDEVGRPLDVPLVVGKARNAPKGLEHRGVKLTGPLLPLRLAIPQLPTPGKYTGSLVLSAGDSDPLIWRIVLNPPGGTRPAALEVNPRTVIVPVRCFYRCRHIREPHFSVSLGDKTGAWPLQAITVRQEQASAGFDLRNLAFWFNGVASAVPGTSPVATGGAAHRAPAPLPWMAARGERPVIGIAVQDLPPGEHTTTLRFQAANSSDDDGQKLALTVRVRHTMLWAFLFLLFALLVSFGVTKALVTIRQRLAFMARARDLRTGWLAQMEPVLAVVWARDVLHQTEALSRRYWLTGQDRIDARLNQISALLGVLQQVHGLQRDFARHALPDFVKVRALAALNRIVRDLDGASLSDQQAAQIKTQLQGLADWVVASKQEACYWADLSAAIDELLGAVRADDFPAQAQEVVTALKADLEQKRANPPKGVPALMQQVEETYARLKILWDRRATPEFRDLLTLERQAGSLRALFRVADDAVWQRLTHAAPTITLAQSRAGEAVEAYEPLMFSLKAEPAVAGSYLFEHGLVFRWTFVQASAHDRETRFSGESREPSVVAYADKAGRLTASAIVENPATGATLAIPSYTVDVVESSEFKWTRLFESVELASFGIAGVIAMVSGLSLLYAKNPTFGSLQDYLGLFLWGVGVDQGKNLVQLLKS